MKLKLCLLTYFFFSILNLIGQIPDSTNLPLVVIDTKGQIIIEDSKITASMKIISNGPQFMNHPGDSGNNYNGFIGIEIRGRYSASLPQKPYGLETRDSAGNNLNVNLLGMPKENDWILLANYNDKSFVRNALAFKLFRQMGHWAPRTRLCEVLINNEYLGIYQLTEKIKIDDDRINLDKITVSDNSGDAITGGYVFSIDYYDASNSWKGNYAPYGYPNNEVYYVYNFPKPVEITWQQKSYIQNYVNNFEKALYGTNYKDPDVGYLKYIDVGSFVDYFIVSELSRNVDGYKKSCFYHKQRDSKGGKIFAGPVWDFDWAWKNIGECFFSATDGSGWAYKVLECQIWPSPNAWMPRLMNDTGFLNQVKLRYTQLRQTILSEEYLFGYIDSVNNLIHQAQKRHYQKWQILGQNVGAPEVDFIPSTYEGETLKFKNWISTRLQWLDSKLLVSASVPHFNASTDYFTISPNPAKDNLKITAGKTISGCIISNTSGKILTVEASIRKQEFEINTSGLNPGVYLIKINFSDGISKTGIFIIK
ncbi:MAG: CotH kinase family protein [Bacteroidales bacterium]